MDLRIPPEGYMVMPVSLPSGERTGEWVMLTPLIYEGPEVPMYDNRETALKVAWILFSGFII